MPRVSEVIHAAQEIVAAPQNRHELVSLSSGLTHVYLACMAKLMEGPPEEPFRSQQPDENDCRLLTMPQAADRLSLPLYTVREMGRRGELPVIHRGRRVLVSLAALKQFIRSNESNGNGLHTRETRQVRPGLPRRIR